MNSDNFGNRTAGSVFVHTTLNPDMYWVNDYNRVTRISKSDIRFWITDTSRARLSATF